MQSDIEFNILFGSHPPFLFDLTKISREADYTLKSVNIKEISRTMDGLMESNDPSKPNFVVEFHGKKEAEIYPRAFLEMSTLKLQNPKKDYCGILIFLNENLDPKPWPWTSFITKKIGFQVFYLPKLLKEFGEKFPNHPLVAVFQPYLEKNQEILVKNVPKYYDQIQNSNFPPFVKENLEKVFNSWLCSRFNKKNVKELKKMFAEVFETAGFRSSVLYNSVKEEVIDEVEELVEKRVKERVKKEVKEEVKEEIKEEIKEEVKEEVKKEVKVESEISLLKRLYEKQSISDEIFRSLMVPLEKKLEEIQIKTKQV